MLYAPTLALTLLPACGCSSLRGRLVIAPILAHRCDIGPPRQPPGGCFAKGSSGAGITPMASGKERECSQPPLQPSSKWLLAGSIARKEICSGENGLLCSEYQKLYKYHPCINMHGLAPPSSAKAEV